MKRCLVLLLITLVVYGSFGTMRAEAQEGVSIIQLIATPEKFDGKRIHLVGFARLSLEDSAVFLSETDAQLGIRQNGIAVVTPDRQILKRTAAMDRQYVYVEGVFHSDNKGPQGLYSGAIDGIERFELWAPKQL